MPDCQSFHHLFSELFTYYSSRAPGADEQDVINTRAQYRKTMDEYVRFSKAMDIPQQRQRIYVDSLGNVGSGKVKGAKEIPEIRPAKIGAKRRGKVTDDERTELLYRRNNRLLTSAENSGIIIPKPSFVVSMQHFAERDIERQESSSLKRAIRKYNQRIAEHKEYIRNPKVHCPDWDSYSEQKKNGLVRHWEKEIRNFEESIQNRIDELKRRGDYDE